MFATKLLSSRGVSDRGFLYIDVIRVILCININVVSIIDVQYFLFQQCFVFVCSSCSMFSFFCSRSSFDICIFCFSVLSHSHLFCFLCHWQHKYTIKIVITSSSVSIGKTGISSFYVSVFWVFDSLFVNGLSLFCVFPF